MAGETSALHMAAGAAVLGTPLVCSLVVSAIAIRISGIRRLSTVAKAAGWVALFSSAFLLVLVILGLFGAAFGRHQMLVYAIFACLIAIPVSMTIFAVLSFKQFKSEQLNAEGSE